MDHFKRPRFLIGFLLCCFLVTDPAGMNAFGGGGRRMKNKSKGDIGVSKSSTSLEEQQAQGLIPTGLKPIYPAAAECLEVASFFGDRTRYDGSFRTPLSNHGYHGGIDISVPVGTPIVAIADGTVVQVAQAGRLVGIKITLQHAPEDTGLPVWTYSKYQHLDAFPKFAIGERVKMGQVIGLSGITGTTGGHYGESGYPHLHMNIYASDSNAFKIVKEHILKPENMTFLDPLAFYFQKELDSHAIQKMPAEEKAFPIPYMTPDGKLTPSQTKVIWPFLCGLR